MANVLAELFKNTANAIREKTGETGKMKPAEFPEKIRAIEAGGEAELEPLIVTENGIYHPKESVEIGGTYTLRNDYTQEELQAFYEASAQKSMDSSGTIEYAFLHRESATMFGALLAYGMYGLYISDGHVWIPEALASRIELSEGWHFGTDLANMTPAYTPTITFGEKDHFYIEGGMTSLAPLFDLRDFDGFSVVGVNVKPNLEELTVTENGMYEPSETDGFSKVTVNVPTGSGSSGERNVVVTSGEYIPTSENEVVTVTHNLGCVPDMIIIRITGQLPTVTPILTVFCGTFFSKDMVSPSEITGYYQLFGSNSGKLTSGTGKNDFRESSDYNFVNEVNGQTFKLGSEFARHLVGVTYNWTAFGNMLT